MNAPQAPLFASNEPMNAAFRLSMILEASTLAPLDYTNLLLAVALGFYFFGEVPHWSMWVGAPLVIAAGLIILWREYRRYAAVPAPVVPNN